MLALRSSHVRFWLPSRDSEAKELAPWVIPLCLGRTLGYTALAMPQAARPGLGDFVYGDGHRPLGPLWCPELSFLSLNLLFQFKMLKNLWRLCCGPVIHQVFLWNVLKGSGLYEESKWGWFRLQRLPGQCGGKRVEEGGLNRMGIIIPGSWSWQWGNNTKATHTRCFRGNQFVSSHWKLNALFKSIYLHSLPQSLLHIFISKQRSFIILV